MLATREDLAWAAGLFEGEGCFSFAAGHVNRSLHAAINMTDRDVVQRFQAVVGIGAIYPRPPMKENWKPQWTWSVGSFEHVQAIIAMLWPWLCSRRRAKARLVLKRYHDREPASLKLALVRTANIKHALLNMQGRTQEDIAREYGVTPGCVTLIKQRGTGYQPRPQLKREQHDEIRRLHATGAYTHRTLASMFQRSQPMISRIVNLQRGA